MPTKTQLTDFAKDTLKGLSARKKSLHPKYFYDEEGSKIFREIMHMPEYYLTRCEQEIFQQQTPDIAAKLLNGSSPFSIIELGPGDGLKTKILLRELAGKSTDFQYVPVDISEENLEILNRSLEKEIPALKVKIKAGDYFHIIKELHQASKHRKIILFLGSNIGNFMPDEADVFLSILSGFMHAGDQALVGFDLKKPPEVVVPAYDDPGGHTRDFNMNHLARINRELNADFDLNKFEHRPVYDPGSGAMESYLVSSEKQTVNIEGLNKSFTFNKGEKIFMELSKKFDLEEIGSMARKYGFRVQKNYLDSRKYFADSLWEKY